MHIFCMMLYTLFICCFDMLMIFFLFCKFYICTIFHIVTFPNIYIYRCLNFYLYMHIYIYIVCMYMYMMICAGCFYCMILAHYTYVWYSILLHLQTYVYIYVCIIFHIATFTNLYIYICLNIYLYVCAYIYIYTCTWLYLQGALIACCLDYCLPWQGWAKWFGDWHRFCML